MTDQMSQWLTAGYLAIAALAVASSLIGLVVPDGLQVALLVVAVSFLGLPHGALDPLIAHSAGLAVTPLGQARFMAIYLSQALATAFVWWLFPSAALGAFLLLSIWHFQGDWSDALEEWQGISVAAAIVTAPVVFHASAVEAIFTIVALGEPVSWLMLALQSIGLVALLATAATAAMIASRQPLLAVELISLPILAWSLPPLLFFVVYFCVLHSPRHVVGTLQKLQMSRGVVLLTAAAITAVTIILAAAAYTLIPEAQTAGGRALAVVFIGLAALTVPHMVLLERVQRKENQR